jgi:hypothetical protein
MSSSSFTSSSRPARAPTPATRFLRRLSWFLLPLTVITLLGTAMALLCGELLPVRVVAWLQTGGKPFVFLPQLSDHTYRFKLEAVLRRRPEALALGSSRANQWRSAMFRPTGFYNAANAVFTVRDFHRMLEEFGDFAPRVIIFSVDYFTFVPAFEWVYRYQSKSDLGSWASPEQIRIIQGVLAELARNPRVPWASHDGVAALGLAAIRTGAGFRPDGSYHYGPRAPVDGESTVAAIEAGTQWPLRPATRLDDAPIRDFERFTDLARRRGIALVGVTMPFVPEVRAAMERSPLYQAWRQFESPETKQWIRKQGVIYFDFGKLESFGGRPNEFADPFHPSEPAHIRMLLSMLADDKFRTLFPKLDARELEEKLKHATVLEAYRNEF